MLRRINTASPNAFRPLPKLAQALLLCFCLPPARPSNCSGLLYDRFCDKYIAVETVLQPGISNWGDGLWAELWGPLA